MQNLLFTIATIVSLLFAMPVFAQTDVDKSMSPYFQVNSKSSIESLPLLSSDADVQIVGSIADVTVTQTYQNRGAEPIEAIYVFPGSTQAAVYGMKAIVGGETIVARIKEKKEAKAIYTSAVKEGKRAALLEQERPNVFKMSVGNILPGDEIKVILNYTELLVPEDNVYEFYYPAVVGPRFTGEDQAVEESFTHNPYVKSGSSAPFTSDITTNIQSGIGIKSITSPSHELNSNFKGINTAEVLLSEKETNPLGKDYILRYKLAGDEIETGLLLYDNGDEKFFTLMMQPPAVVEHKDIPQREFVFIVDISGSMRGFPLEVSKNLLRDLFMDLRPIDRFNIVFFAGGSEVWKEESVNATNANLEEAINYLSNTRGSGGTRLLSALKTAMALPECLESEARSFVIVSDGYISVERECFDYISRFINKSNFFSFGIGSSPNVHLMEGIAHVGGGEAVIVQNKDEATRKAKVFKKYIAEPVLTKIKVKYSGFEAYDLIHQNLPDVLAQRPVVLQGKLKDIRDGKICISGFTGKGKYKKCISLDEGVWSDQNNAIRYHWAREKVRWLDDYRKNGFGSDGEKETLALGLKYNLLTAYTSFVAVQESKVTDGNPQRVKQPLPLPKHVQNSAVGFDLAVEGVSLPKKKKATVKKAKYQIASMTFKGQRIANPMLFETIWLDVFEALKTLKQFPSTVEIKINERGEILSISVDGKELNSWSAVQLRYNQYAKLQGLGPGTLKVNFSQ